MDTLFWNKVQKTSESGCWLWQGTIGKGGYGLLHRKQKNGKGRTFYAHRYAYEQSIGSIPQGQDIRHLCPGGSNKRCCNPAHMMPGTPIQNARDAVLEGKSGKQILTVAQVLRIRELHATGKYTYVMLGKMFRVHAHTISNAVTGHTFGYA